MGLELVCIRHGKTQWNKDKRYLGHTDIGILQESLTELLPVKNALEGRTFHKIFCSDLKRCRETLDWIYSASTDSVVFDNRLREMDFGDWEGKTYDQLKHYSIYREWLDNPQSVTPPGGEAWEHFQGRLADFMNSLTCWVKEEGKDNHVLMVTHGGVIRQLATMTIPDSTFWDFSADPGSLLTLKLTCDKGKWIGHL
ncbi:alpha-ribazole phosphatase [Paenibacillus uliginis N3/975]|uniref:Alpha-ribazole phosphatase n=1 Tax=Paenibacillus uliginis N3/975 TaxID=1313296 RepID=A0A1X7GQJ2_9BACL|nr:histidine phosphatase family protein [Paenibacillus uliginis]SMF73261.1 alpha-ribazole phosphatase [Paenibacillus uliginis N3/975]